MSLLRKVLIAACLCAGFTTAAAQTPQTVGRWDTQPTTMPINPVHVALTYDGKLLIIAGSGNDPAVFSTGVFQHGVLDPQTGQLTTQRYPWDMFCNGMVILPDGRPFILSGTLRYDPFYGELRTSAFNPALGTFTDLESMAHGRWYPTATVLGDGRVFVFSGYDENGATNKAVEIYRPGVGWGPELIAPWTPPLYPRQHLLPNGKIFFSGSNPSSHIFDPATSAWTLNVASTNYGGNRYYGSSVLLPLSPANNYAAKVMILGGGDPATSSTEIIDFSAVTPKWHVSAPMTNGRIEMNAVLLPNGTVLALGGSVNDEDKNTATLAADLFDPVTETFSSAGQEAFARLYHSSAILLPDGRVWVAGGNPVRGTYEPHVEIYSPKYLFTSDSSGNTLPAVRPTIANVPSEIMYGAPFTVQTPDAANISSISLIRAGAVTHAFDMDQRLVKLSFTASAGSLSVVAPPNGNIAPPGYYLIFILNAAGVPSVAKFVHISAANNQPPAGTISQPAADVTINEGQSVSFAGSGTDSDGTIASYAWNLPGGTPSSSNVQNPGAVTYSLAGTYTAKLTVTDNLGAIDPNPPTRTITVQALPVAGTPTFTPAPGSFTTAQSVSIADSTSGATIYFTTDGSTPTTSSLVYLGPINVTATTTLRAIAAAAGFKNSAIASGTYVIQGQGCAACPNFTTGFAAGAVQLNGSAAITATKLRLTNGGLDQSSSAFFKTPVNVQSFTNDFSFQITNPGADGMTFVIQNTGLTAKGDLGGGLGYGSDPEAPGGPSILKSVAVKFDIYDNLGEGANSTGIYQNGGSPALPSIPLAPVDLFAGHVLNVHMTYDGTTLVMTITDGTNSASTFSKSFPINIPGVIGSNTAYVGFTGGTGGASATQDILKWTYTLGLQTLPNQAPVGTISQPTGNVTITAGQTVTFGGSGTDPDGTVASYAWSLPGGTPSSSVLQNPGAVTFSTAGIYTAKLTVTDNLGLADANPPIRTITVNPPPNQAPVGTISAPTGNVTITAGQTVTFTGGGTDSDGTVASYAWTLPGGAPSSSALQNPGAVTFSTAGTYTAKLTVTDNLGLADANPPTRTITVNPAPNQPPVGTISQPAGNVTITAGQTVTFTGGGTDSDGTVASYAWTLPGGTPSSSAVQNPGAVTFSSAGTYTAKLTVTDNLGLADANPPIRTITVNPPPNQAPVGTISAPAGNVTITAGQTVTFAGSGTDSDGTVVAYAWSLPGGTPSSSPVQNPGAVTFSTAGTYTAKLTVTDNLGLADATPPTRTITVNPAPNQPPVGAISSPAGNVTITAGQIVTFAGSGTDPDGTVVSYAWSLPGGTPSSSALQNPGAVTFSTAGTYTAKLTVTDNLGLADANPPTRTITVTATPDQPPVGTISSPAGNVIITAGQTVIFAGSGTDPDGTVASYAWNLPGGTPSSSAAQNPGGVTFSTAGTYIASLTVTDNLGLADANPPTRTITVNSPPNQPPVGTISQPAGNVTITAGQTVSFAGSGTDSDGSVASFAWSLPGGTPSSSAVQNPGAVTFATAGTYTAKLTVTDNLGLADANPPTRTITVSAPNQPPVGNISQPAGNVTITAGQTVIFAGSGTDPDGTVASYAWSLPGGTPSSSGTQNPGAVTFSAAGTYTAKLTVTDNLGLADPNPPTRTITVNPAPNQPPVGSISSPAGNVTITAGQTVSFAGSGSDPDGTVASYAWSLPGGTPSSSTTQNPGAVTFATAGTYTAKLIVTDNLGLADANPPTRTITVNPAPNQPPVGSISSPAGNVTITAGQTVTFAGSGTDPDGTVTSYAWTLPGGTPSSSTAQNPGVVTFSIAGIYTAKLTVTDNLGLADANPPTRTITVNAPANQPPVGTISQPAANASISAGQSVTFAGSGIDSDGTIASYAWSLPGGTPSSSTAQNPGAVAFSTAGTYTAKLTVKDNLGAVDPNPPTRVITVTAATTAATPTFSPAPGTYSAAQNVTVSDTTSGAVIYYTTDSTTPTTASKKYTGPIAVSTSTTIKALAVATGFKNSAVATGTYVVQAQGCACPSFGNGFVAGVLQLNTPAALSGTKLRLTNGGFNQSSTAFFKTLVNVQSFTNDFSFQITNPGADGMTFVIQNTVPTAKGDLGGGLGYGSDPEVPGGPSIGKSVAVKFDIYDNLGEGANSTGLYKNGASPALPSISMSPVNLLSGHILNVHMTYDGTTLTMIVTDASDATKTFTTSFAVDIPTVVGGNTAFVGFTGGTGGLSATQDVLSWTYVH